MKMREIIDKVSDLYRSELANVSDLQTEHLHVWQMIQEADKTHGENITVADYRVLQNRIHDIEREIELKTQYYGGISCVREMLMDMVFDAEVE